MITKYWTLANSLLDTAASYVRDPLLFLIRICWGWQFFLSGKGKLADLDKVTDFFTELHLPLPRVNAMMAGSVECFGGLLLLVGLFSRVISVPLMFTMIVAYLTADQEALQSIFSDTDKFTSAAPFLFLLASAIIFAFGPGKFSVDAFLPKAAKGKPDA